LFTDFIYKPGTLTPWLGYDFRTPESFERTAEQLVQIDFARQELTATLSSQNREFGAPGSTIENIDLMVNRNALCVVAGHQVILLGGPLMVLYKVITVIKLAQKLSDLLARPVVPVFWLATDDHDFAEVDHILLPAADGKLEKIRYETADLHAGKPMSDIQLDRAIENLLDQTYVKLAETEFRDDLIDLLRSCYCDGAMIFESFARFLLHYFGEHGLIIVDPTSAELRSLASETLAQAVSDFETIKHSLRETGRSLLDAGYHLQVTRDEEYLNLFLAAGRRSRISYRNGRISIDGTDQVYSPVELTDTIRMSHGLFSPDVLLRLVVQSRLFPVLAFVGGPAEISYFAQVRKLFPLFKTVPPVVYPRLSASIVETRWADFIENHGIDTRRLVTYAGREAYLTSILRERFPSRIEGSLEATRTRIMAEFGSIGEIVEADDSLERTIEQTRRKIDYELNSLKGKIFKAHRKAHDDFARKFRRAGELIFPEQSLQERHCSFIYFLNKYGPGVVNRINDTLDIEIHEHQIMLL
jgi:bacillithiol biosynthesis cysteine-adding enzyme BshC